MTNRPREIRRLLRLAALTAAKGLYPGPKYTVSEYGGDIYVDQNFANGEQDCKLIVYAPVIR